MKCRACKCVWYCDKECQNKHWKEHKKECKRIKKELDKRGGKLDLGTELDVGPSCRPAPAGGVSNLHACVAASSKLTHILIAVARLSAAVAIISTR